jgi:deoxycytidylate deaminase
MKLPHSVLDLALTQAQKSPMHYKHGAVVWKGKRILGSGYNWPVAPPCTDKRRFSIHSERDALKGLRGDQIRGASILSIRARNDGSINWGAPCKGCEKLLRRKGIRNVYWFDEAGALVCTRLN